MSALRAGHGQASVWPQEVVAALSAGLASADLDGTEICRTLARAAALGLGDTAVVRVLQTGERALIPAAVEGDDATVVASVRLLMATIPVSANSANPYAETLRTGHARSITGAELSAMQRTLPLDMQGEFEALRVTAIFVVPLRALGQGVGTLGCWRHGSRPVHDESEQTLAHELANGAAPAILAAQTLAELARERARRRKTEASLRSTSEIVYRLHEGRKALAESVIEAQEHERGRIAANVHDDAIQAMSTISLRLQLLRRKVDDPSLMEAVDDLEDTVDDAIGRLRALLVDLDPALLEAVGLEEATRTFCRQTLRPAGINALVRSSMRSEPTDEARTLLYRIAQEAVRNVRRHSDAEYAIVSFDSDDEGWTVSIRDDGRGFNVADVMARDIPGHVGLRGMQDRTSLAGGRLEIISAPGEGTEVRSWLPSAPAEAHAVGHRHPG